MLENYLPVLIFLMIGMMVGVGAMFIGGFVLGPSKPNAAKNSPFECGFEAFDDARMKFDVRYYLVQSLAAILLVRGALCIGLRFDRLGVVGME